MKNKIINSLVEPFRFVFWLYLVFTFNGLNAQNQINVVLSGEPSTQFSLVTLEINQIDYVNVRELADILGAGTYNNSLAKKVVIYLGNHRIKVTAVNPFVLIEKVPFQMPVDTHFDGKDIWVPLRYFIPLISDYSPSPLSYDQHNHFLTITREGYNIVSVKLEEKVNGALIRIRTLRKFSYPNVNIRVSHGWLYIDIYGGKLDNKHMTVENETDLIKNIATEQQEESCMIAFRLAKNVERKDVSISDDENNIFVHVRTSEHLPENFLVNLEEERKKWLIDRIIIDAGHGGRDPGAVHYGIKEKDIVLDIAKMLKKIIEKELKIEVLLTRDSDRYVKLRERSAFANRNEGKLFISIHANAFPNKRTKGVRTFCFGLAKTEEDRRIAEKENRVIQEYEDVTPEEMNLTNENIILMAMAQNSFTKESLDLATFVQNSAAKSLNLKYRDIRQAHYKVLVGTAMPKILVEVGFLTNPSEAKKLRSKKYRQKLAEIIFNGIKEFKEQSERFILGN